MSVLPDRDSLTAVLEDMARVHAASSAVLRAVDDLAVRPLDSSLAVRVTELLDGELVARGRDAHARLLQDVAAGWTPGGQSVVAPPGCPPGTIAGAPSLSRAALPAAGGGVRAWLRVPGPTAKGG